MPTITDEMVDTLNQRLANVGNPLRITKGSGRDIDYDSKMVIEKPNPTLAPLLVDQYEYTNCGSSTQQVTGSIKKTVEGKYSWNIRSGLKIGASVEAEAGIIFATVKTTASTEISLEGGKEETTTETIEISNDFPFSVPTMTKTRLQATVKQEKVENLPFTANVILRQGIFKAAAAGSLPFYRYYNTNSREHFYTTNYGELGGGGGGWKAEGVAGYIFSSPQPGTNPLHRYYNRKDRNHFYTANFSERGSGGGNWNYEGVAGFIFPDGLDLDIASTLSINDRTFHVNGTFKGQSISRSTEVFLSEQPMTEEACDILARSRARTAGAKGAVSKAAKGAVSKAAKTQKAFYVNKTPDKELPSVDLLINKRGVKKINVRSK